MTILECHSRGDRRFSALYARLKVGHTIEFIYQYAKLDEQGQRFEHPKGQLPTSLFVSMQVVPAAEVQYPFYRMLWHIYILEHPDLLRHAATFDAFHDMFERGGSHVYRWDDTALPQKCLQSIAIADIVGHLKRGERYVYPPILQGEWNSLRK